MSGSTTISSSEPRLANIRIQTSAYGLVIPLIYGRARVGGNLSWYGNFKAIAHTTTTEAGGKGGGGVKQSNTTYTYEAAVIMTLGHGPINGVVSAWKGKERLGGANVAGKVRTLGYNVLIPAGGVVTVPEAAVFKAPVQVSGQTVPSYTEAMGLAYGWGLVTEGIDFTRSGGTYTFVAALVGFVIDIQYQVQDSSLAQSALGQLGLALATGTPAQAAWSWLATFNPAESLTYSGFAYVYGQSYSLENSAQLPNHNFEVSTPWERADLGTVDAHPADIVEDLLRDPVRGVGWSADGIASLQPYRDYCTAHGLFMSPVLDTQRSAIDWIKALLALTNSDVVYSGNKIKIVPLGDENKTGNGVTFVANTTPVFDLTVEDFVTGGGPRIRIIRNGADDVRGADGNDVARNVITLEIENRANGYAIEPVSAEDLASMEQFGRRPANTQKAGAIKSVAVGRMVAQLMLQREQGRRAQYEFTLWANCSLLEPLDLVTLTDTDTGLDRWPVRILSIDERDAHSFDVVAEDAPIGMASAPAYGIQAGSGFQHDYSVAPGNALPPVIFESPGALTTTGLELCVATTSTNPNWGGCVVWASYDGGTYQRLGQLAGGSRYGTLTAPAATGSVPVLINTGQLLSGSASDLAAFATLCYIGGPTPEWIAYQTASLTSAMAYTLSPLSRGLYETNVVPHSTGDVFVRVDGAVARSAPLDPALIGKTVYIKLCSFNVYGGAEQSLADVSATAYVITGAFQSSRAGVRTFRQEVAPSRPHEGDLWIKPSLGVQWRWDATVSLWLSAATSNRSYRQFGDPAISPGGIGDGDEWLQTDIGGVTLIALFRRVAGAWVSGPASFSLVARGQCVASGRTVQKVGGIGAWDSDAYSQEAFTGGAFCSFQAAQANADFMCGLNADPATDSGYASIDYAIFAVSNGLARIYESGGYVGDFGTYTTSTAFSITYDGTFVRYLIDGVVVRAVAAPAGLKLFFDSSFYTPGSAAKAIKFGPLTDIAAVTAAAASAASAASAAQASANGALAQLTDIASDGILSQVEKPPVIQDNNVILAEQAGIDAQAVNYAVTTEKTAYDAAVSALTAYLATLTAPVLWNNLTGNTTIVGATFRSKFADVYTTRQAVLDKVAANAKARLGALATLNTVGTGQIDLNAATANYELVSAKSFPFSTNSGPDSFDGVAVTPNVDCLAEVVAVFDGAASSSSGGDYGGSYFGLYACQLSDITVNQLDPRLERLGSSATLKGLNGARTTRDTFSLQANFALTAGVPMKLGMFGRGSKIFQGPSYDASCWALKVFVTLVKR